MPAATEGLHSPSTLTTITHLSLLNPLSFVYNNFFISNLSSVSPLLYTFFLLPNYPLFCFLIISLIQWNPVYIVGIGNTIYSIFHLFFILFTLSHSPFPLLIFNLCSSFTLYTHYHPNFPLASTVPLSFFSKIVCPQLPSSIHQCMSHSYIHILMDGVIPRLAISTYFLPHCSSSFDVLTSPYFYSFCDSFPF